MKQLTRYQKRQRDGQREWARFQKYKIHYEHLATLFSGLAIGGSFIFAMGIARGYNTVPEIIAAYGIVLFIGVMLNIREYFVVKSSWRYWKLVIR